MTAPDAPLDAPAITPVDIPADIPVDPLKVRQKALLGTTVDEARSARERAMLRVTRAQVELDAAQAEADAAGADLAAMVALRDGL